MRWDLLWESIKEPLRLLVLGLVSFGIVELAKLDTQWAVVGVLILRFIDKWLHEIGKEKDNSLMAAGLTRF